MRRLHWMFIALAVIALAGCGKKADQAARTGSDSLLATNPVEQPQGNLTPQQQYQGGTQPPVENPAPAATEKPATPKKPKPAPKPAAAANPGVMIPAGTGMSITVAAKITSETANAGDAWTGTVKDPVVVGTSAPFPAGSTVSGIVAASKPAQKGDRAMLVLEVQSVTVGGKTISIHAVSDSMIAGSTRTRNVGAVAGGAAAGALIGHAIGGGKGALIGGLLGGGAAAGGAAASKGYQVTVDEGATVVFHTEHETTVHP